MPLLDKPEPPPASLRWRLPPVHPDGRKFMVAAAAIALVFFWIFDWDTLGWLMVGVTLWIAAFFRDPVRTTPVGRGLIIAPADGMVTMIATVPPPRELAGADGLGSDPVVRVSIYMSMFDCHVIRSPVEGIVSRVAYVQGKLVNPQFDKASEDNEREHLMVQGPGGQRIGFTMVAGVIGRRIVSWVKEGEPVVAGQRAAMIRFGSRTDVYLPAGTSSQVLLGQRTVAGETVLARLGVAELIEGVAQ
ncbi:MAG TPA: phosphatidylserine decarboxylase [Allosphingosinicella sp.]|nr:phosphatidylserine decarboxylase [Allosphingosinicella sp.]